MRRFSVVVALLVASAVGAAAQQPESAPVDRAVLVVLDVSTSMNLSVRGGVRRDLAVRGLLSTLGSLPQGTVVGLRLLGQGTASGRCVASRSAIPLAPFSAAQWETTLGGLRWRGATPLVYAMREALADIRAVPAVRREVIIIGDGEDVCGEDPVAVARAEAGEVRIHTISLGEQVSHEMAGIALVTDGIYTRAYDETTMVDATSAIVDSPAEKSGPAATAGASRLEVILDVSNSMWGQIRGRSRIELAREAIGKALVDVPADIAVGLRAYGHRVSVQDRVGGCADTERLVAAAPGNAPTVAARVRELTPRGQTPIARSLEEAGADLRAEGGAGIVLLVTDGVESCGGDPEAVVAALRASGLQIVLHTVGLGVTPEEAKALAALAAAGGGTYVPAESADDLTEGLKAAVPRPGPFVMQRATLPRFPRDVARVSGGATLDAAEIIEPGVFSFIDHLFGQTRYFAVRGTPGRTVTLRGLVSSLGVLRMRSGTVRHDNVPGRMPAQGVAANGQPLPGRILLVQGQMGTWREMTLPVAADGLARFRIGGATTVHRDMIFSVAR